ncbi:MAG: ATP-binding protein, partial [Pseudomonadota bacterium]
QLIGRDKLDCVPPALRRTVEASDREAWSAGGLIVRAQGDARDGLRILTYKHVIRDAAGERWLVAASLDIAELDRTLEELAALSGALESEVRQRTDELETALEQAKAADRAKSEFLATMSHELRTPLNAILGFGQILATGVAPDRSAEYGEMISRAGGHLTALINDILDYARMETGRLTLEFERFSPVEMLREVVSLMEDEAAAKGVALKADDHGPDAVALLSDPRRVRQVLLNLVSNAVKFTDEGSVAVRCAVIRKDAGVIGVEFSVSDTGRGIDADAGERIFDPFNDVHDRVHSATPGTGLGLAISRRLAELMGGSIQYASERGAGSTFTFTFEGDAC